MAVSGQIDGQGWAPQPEGNGVPRVRVLGSAVDEHDLDGVGTPAQCTHTTPNIVRHLDSNASDCRQFVDNQVELGDVLMEQTELVVAAHRYSGSEVGTAVVVVLVVVVVVVVVVVGGEVAGGPGTVVGATPGVVDDGGTVVVDSGTVVVDT